MTAVVNRKSRFFIVLLARLTNFPPWYAVTLTVGNRGVLPGSGGGFLGGLAGLVGVLPEVAHQGGVLALFHAVPHALPLGEGVERVSGQHGGEDDLGAVLAALVNGDRDGGAAGGAHRCGRISQSADAGAAGQRKIHDRKAGSDDHASDV